MTPIGSIQGACPAIYISRCVGIGYRVAGEEAPDRVEAGLTLGLVTLVQELLLLYMERYRWTGTDTWDMRGRICMYIGIRGSSRYV